MIGVEASIGRAAATRGLTIAAAESCTGGLIGHRLTNHPGSSAYFTGGIIAYANEAKERLLSVRHETLMAHGAVSAETALEMATGVRTLLATSIGLSVTGIAGPAGGSDDKPVGLTFVALCGPEVQTVERHLFGGDREQNKESAADAALQLLLRCLGELEANLLE